MFCVQVVHHQVVLAAPLPAILAKSSIKRLVVYVSHVLAIEVIQHEFLRGFARFVAFVADPRSFVRNWTFLYLGLLNRFDNFGLSGLRLKVKTIEKKNLKDATHTWTFILGVLTG